MGDSSSGAGLPSTDAQLPAGLADRFVARLIDGLILLGVYLVVDTLIRAAFPFGLVMTFGERFVYNLVVVTVNTALALGYYAFLESTRGQTVGKQVMRLRTIAPGGRGAPTVEQSLKRNAFLALSLIGVLPPFAFTVLGAIATLGAMLTIAIGINADPARRQAWHDRLAGGTRVLKIG